MQLGRALRELREQRGISQKALAKSLGRDNSYISRIEAGERLPSLSILTELAEALRVPASLLLLLGSEKEDLLGVPTDQAHELAHRLLEMCDETRANEEG